MRETFKNELKLRAGKIVFVVNIMIDILAANLETAGKKDLQQLWLIIRRICLCNPVPAVQCR